MVRIPFNGREIWLSQVIIEQELLEVEYIGLFDEDEVVLCDAEGVVVGRVHLPLAGNGGDDLGLLD